MAAAQAIELVRTMLLADSECDCCRAPLLNGERAYLHEPTWTVGCSQDHCESAASHKLAAFDGSLPCEVME